MQAPERLINQGAVLNPSLMDTALGVVAVACDDGAAEVRKAQLTVAPCHLGQGPPGE